MVRPILEYACSAWSPYTQVNINKLEMVQHCVARFITGNYFYQASVTAMLAKLDLSSLVQRRDNMKLVTFHKIINQQIQIPNNELNLVHTATQGHHRRYTRPLSRADFHLHSFFSIGYKIMEQFTPGHSYWNRFRKNLNNWLTSYNFLNWLAKFCMCVIFCFSCASHSQVEFCTIIQWLYTQLTAKSSLLKIMR